MALYNIEGTIKEVYSRQKNKISNYGLINLLLSENKRYSEEIIKKPSLIDDQVFRNYNNLYFLKDFDYKDNIMFLVH